MSVFLIKASIPLRDDGFIHQQLFKPNLNMQQILVNYVLLKFMLCILRKNNDFKVGCKPDSRLLIIKSFK